jgi:hypothetical protein
MTGILVAKIVRELERYYDAIAEEVEPFVRPASGGEADGRESLLVRESPAAAGEEEALELRLVLPAHVAEAEARAWPGLSLDDRCQLVEGASHFLLVCERARSGRATTQLELELQAEVDKWLVLSRGGRLAPEHDDALIEALYGEPEYLHDADSVEGERYRLANRLGARFARHLSRSFARKGRHRDMRHALARFFRMSQEEKLRAAAG